MSELSELYQQVILDHNKKPRNFRKLETANHSAEGFNPLCGDQLTVYLNVEDDAVKEPVFVPPTVGADPHLEAEPAMVALHGREALLRDLRYLDDL